MLSATAEAGGPTGITAAMAASAKAKGRMRTTTRGMGAPDSEVNGAYSASFARVASAPAPHSPRARNLVGSGPSGCVRDAI
ncbi:hypothetical protein GCM10020227_24590 [Streptomyces flavovirens]